MAPVKAQQSSSAAFKGLNAPVKKKRLG